MPATFANRWGWGVVLMLAVTCAWAGPRTKKPVAPPKVAVPPPYPFPTVPGEPAVYAKAAVVMDAASGRVLWARNPEQKMFPASTTKILTTLLLLEQTDPGDVITAPAEIKTIGEASLHLEPKEQLTAQNMAYAMMVRSANDACYAVAKYLGGNLAGFADEMNARAQRIGCTNTHFVNPNGLHHPEHYTSAHDLARIAREAMKNDQFRALARTSKVEISRSSNQADRWLISKNHQLRKDITCDGIKTGYTKPAGPCFVGAVSREGWRVITVVMNSVNWQLDHENLAAWAIKTFTPKRLVEPGDEFDLHGRKVASPEPVEIPVRKDNSEQITYRTEAKAGANLAKFNEKAGDLVISSNGKPIHRSPLLVRETAPIALKGAKPRSDWSAWALGAGATCLGVIMIRSARRL